MTESKPKPTIENGTTVRLIQTSKSIRDGLCNINVFYLEAQHDVEITTPDESTIIVKATRKEYQVSP